ncbi:MAG: hypothetical protein ACTSQE_03190 [Candidatus Heimdallarchaeaceae archaeon]
MNAQTPTDEKKENFFTLIAQIDELALHPSMSSHTTIEVKLPLKEKGESLEKQSIEFEAPAIQIKSLSEDISKSTNVLHAMEKQTSREEWSAENKESELFMKLETIYPEFECKIHNIYYSPELNKEQVAEKIQRVLSSLKEIELEDILTFLYPFTLHKVGALQQVELHLNVDQINIPLFLTKERENLRFHAIGKNPFSDLSDKISEEISNKISDKWNYLLNQLQITLVPLIKEGKIKDKESKNVSDFLLSDLDYDSLESALNDSIAKIEVPSLSIEDINEDNFDLIALLEEGFWLNNHQFERAQAYISSQIDDIRQEIEEKDTIVQEDYVELKKMQKMLEYETQKYKKLEYQGVVIERDKKESLATRFNEFQKKKVKLQKQISNLKTRRTLLDQWSDIIHEDNLAEAQKKLRAYFGKEIEDKISELKAELQDQIEDKEITTTLIDKSISLHILWIPVNLIKFKAKQNEEKIDGTAFYVESVEILTLIQPSVA